MELHVPPLLHGIVAQGLGLTVPENGIGLLLILQTSLNSPMGISQVEPLCVVGQTHWKVVGDMA
jgi:hypothetical protein